MSATLRLVAVASAFATLLVAPPASAGGRTGCAAMPVTGHRGGAGQLATENTVGAFDAGAAAGATRVELDVRMTADRRLVVMHDRTVDRTTDGTGAVAEMTIAKFQSLRADDGQPVPTVAKSLAAIADTGTSAYLHLKALGGRRSYLLLKRLVYQAGMGRRVLVGGFASDPIKPFYDVAPRMTRWLVTYEPPTASKAAVAGFDTVMVYPEDLTASMVKNYRARGVELTTGSNLASQWSRFVSLGVDGFSTDDVRAYKRWCATGTSPRIAPGPGLG